MDGDRPIVTALVGYYAHPWGVIGRPKIVPLAEAAIYHELGFAVLVDPASEAELAAWERARRALQPKRRWFDGL